MIQTMKVEILGMKKFVGEVEGKKYDSTKIFVKTNLDTSTGNAVGFTCQEYPAGKSDIFDKYRDIPLPAEFEVDMMFVSTGKAMKQTITAVRHTTQFKKAA